MKPGDLVRIKSKHVGLAGIHGWLDAERHAQTMEAKISELQAAGITDQLGRKLPLPDHHRDCPHGQNGLAMCTCDELKARDNERMNGLIKDLANDLRDDRRMG